MVCGVVRYGMRYGSGKEREREGKESNVSDMIKIKLRGLSNCTYIHTHILTYSYSCTHILIYPYTHILIHPYTHILIYSYTHILIYSYTHTLINSHTNILIYSYTTITYPLLLVPGQSSGPRNFTGMLILYFLFTWWRTKITFIGSK